MKSEVKVYTHEELIQGTDSNGQWVDDYNVFDVVAKSDFDKLSLELRKAKREIEVLREQREAIRERLVDCYDGSIDGPDWKADRKNDDAEIKAAREEVK